MKVKAIYDNLAKRSFAESDINTVITLVQRPERGEDLSDHSVRFVAFKKPFEDVVTVENLAAIEAAGERTSTEDYRLRALTQDQLLLEGSEKGPEEERPEKVAGPLIKVARYIGDKWGGKYLRAPDIYFTILEKGKGKLVRLGDIAEVRFGIKTGANEFFYLDEERIEEWGIEQEFLRPVIKSPRECKTILIKPEDLKYEIFMCHKEKRELQGTKALGYIKWGESQGFHKRPTCATRPRWWDLGERRLPPIISPSSVNELYRVFENPGVLADKRLYEIYCEPEDTEELLASINCTMSSLFLEVGSRTGLGEGLLDLTVYEVADCPVMRPELCQVAPASMKQRLVQPIEQELASADRLQLDSIVFDTLRLSPTEREAVYEAVISLVDARLKKAESV
jgi:hypothetical protein